MSHSQRSIARSIVRTRLFHARRQSEVLSSCSASLISSAWRFRPSASRIWVRVTPVGSLRMQLEQKVREPMTDLLAEDRVALASA